MNEKTNVPDKQTPAWPGLLALLFIIGCTVYSASLVIGAFSSGDSKPTPQVVQEQMEIVVSSQSVKEVGGKYRYFFNIKNNDTQAFSGDVKISVLNAEGDSVYDDTFSTSQPLVSGGGTSVYIDANTGPTSVHGSYGIKTYSFIAEVNGAVVKSGSGSINLSANPN